MTNNETKSVPAMSTVQIDKAIEKIHSAINKAQGAYLAIVGTVAQLKDTKSYEVKGYKNIYDMTSDLFGMSRGTTHNLIAINERFCQDYKLLPEAKDMSMREMLRTIAEEKAPKIEDKKEAETEIVEDNRIDDIEKEFNAESDENCGDIFEYEMYVENPEELDAIFDGFKTKMEGHNILSRARIRVIVEKYSE